MSDFDMQSEPCPLYQEYAYEVTGLDNKLSSANAKVAELQTKLAYAEDAAEKGRLARENAGGMEMGIADMEKQVAEHWRTIRKLDDSIGELAKDAESERRAKVDYQKQNLELAATVEKMKEASVKLGEFLDCGCTPGSFIYGCNRCRVRREIIKPALSLTPSSALLAHDLEIAERAWFECAEIFLVCRSGQERAVVAKQTFRDSQTRRSLTEGK